MKVKENTYYGFTCFSRQDYAHRIKRYVDETDSVTFGIYVRNDGCIAEMTMSWSPLQGKEVANLGVFNDAFSLLADTRIQDVFRLLKDYADDKKELTPEAFSRLLLYLGFEDNSDNKLDPKPEPSKPPLTL